MILNLIKKINISETNRSIEFKFCILSIFMAYNSVLQTFSFNVDHFFKSEQFRRPPYSCSLRKQIYQYCRIFNSLPVCTLVSLCAMKGIPNGHWLSEEGLDILPHSFLLSSKLRYVLHWCLSRSAPGFDSRSGQVPWVRFFG